MVELEPFASSDEESYFRLPFTLVDAKGQVWNCVSNKKYLLAERSRSRYRRWPGSGDDLGKMVRFLHSQPPSESEKIKVEDLLRWLGPSPRGQGLLLGVVVPLDQLAQLLATCPLKTVDVWKPGADLVGDERCLGYRAGDRWLVIQMGCAVDSEGLPSFGVEGEELDSLALIDQLMSGT